MQKQIDYNYSLKSIISLLYSENNIGNLILFFSRILEYINRNENKKKEKLYFFQFIYNIINDKLYDSLEKDKKVINERIEVTKLIFCHSGIIEYILKNVYKDNNLEIIYKCLCTLNSCLAKGNKNVQNTLYNYVSYKKNSYNFLSCLEWILSESFDYIKTKNEIFLNNDIKIDNNNDLEMTQYLKQDLRKKEINILKEITSEKIPVFLLKDNSFIYKLPRLVLLFIQLCSDNNENFQHFFRDNEYDKNLNDIILNNDDNIIIKEKGNINLINDIGTLLIKILNLGNLIYYNYDIWRLTKDLVITLTNLCEGPCEQNQIILGLRKAIFSSINILLQREYNLQNKEEINTRKNLLMCYIINFIKSLISPKSLIRLGEILLETIDIYLLIEKLIDIYSIIIEPNEKLLYNGEICNHIKDSENNYINKNNYLDKCEKNQCKKNYVSINEMEFIKTGFNIFIILTNLKDNFPNHQKLSLFDINLEKTKHSQFLKVNQIQRRNLKENNKTSLFDKKEFSDESKNNLLFNMSEIIDFDKTYFKNNFENESENKKTLDNTEFIYSDMNIKEISFLEENFCQRFIKFISCGIFRRNKKNINKSYELYQKNIKLYHSPTNISLYNSIQTNNEINNLKKRFIEKYKTTFNNAYIFYSKHTSSVEITIKNIKIKKYFQIPFIFIYLTKELKLKIINAWKSTAQQSSLREIFNKIENVIQILINKQKLRKYHLLIENIRPIEIISYIFTIIFNIILLIFTTNNDIENCSNTKRASCTFITSTDNKIKYKYIYENINYIIFLIIYIKLFIYFLIFILTIMKRYKIIKNYMASKAELIIEEYKQNKMKKYEGSLLYHRLNDIIKKPFNSYNYIIVLLYKSKGLNIIFDFDILFLLIDITFSFLSIFISPFLQVFSLFDIIRLNSFLKNILYILFKQINKSFFMIYALFIIIFIFSVFEFLLMREYYYSNDYMNIEDNEINLYCDTIYYCFISILHYGINPNNILLIGSNISRNNSIFYIKLVVDLLLICIVFSYGSSTFFSIVINSFKEFNEIMNEKKKIINQKCFICGISKYKLDREEKGWIYHYKREHNIFSYIYFLAALKNKKIEHCDGIEKYVKKCIEKHELIFLPNYNISQKN